MVTRRVKTGGAYVGSGGLGAPSPPQWQNTYEDQEFTGAYVFDPGGGPDQWQYSGSAAYSTRLTDTNDDGRWLSSADNWSAVATLQVIDLDGLGTVIDPTWTFSGTDAFTGGGVQSAILELNSTQVDVGGSWRIRAESNASAASTPWSATHKPGTATATATSVTVVSTSGVPAQHLVDVTTLVNEVMAGAAWVPGTPICFWAEPVTLGEFVSVTFAAVPSASAAKLAMTPFASVTFDRTALTFDGTSLTWDAA